MADEPKAPEPAKPAAPAPATPAAPGAPAAGGGPPTKMIMMGCGGLAAVGLLIVLIWGLLSLLSCGGLSVPGTGADHSTAEKAASSFVTFEEQKQINAEDYAMSKGAKRLDQRRALLPWMADKTEEEKAIKKAETRIQAYNKHRSELRDFKVNVVEVKDGVVRLKVTGKRLEPDGENWKLVDRTDEKALQLTQIEGKWKVKN